MALTRVSGRVVYPHGEDTPTPVTGDGVIEYAHATPGIIDGAVHGPDRKRIGYVAGVAEDAWLKPGMWRAYVYPDQGRSYTLHLGVPEGGETTIADAVGEIVPDGIITRGAPGEPGASVTGGRDNGDGTVSFELSDGTFTDPVTVPPGPAGRGIASISDPDSDSRVTITFTDDSTATVQAIRGADGRTPAITWEGTSIVVDGEQGPDLKGEPGADSTVPGPANTLSIGTVTTGATGSAASATITGTAPAQTLNLTLPRGEQGIPGTATLPDTGWRIIAPASTTLVSDTGSYIRIRRIGQEVTFEAFLRITASGFLEPLYDLPSGFKFSSAPWQRWPQVSTDLALRHETRGRLYASRENNVNQVGAWLPSTGPATGVLTWITDDTFPTNLPGTPA